MRKIRILQPYSEQELARRLSNACGQAKLYVGSNNNATIVVMRNAFDAVRKSRYYRGRTKQLLNAAMAELDAYYYKLQNPAPGEIKIFDISTFDPEFRKNFRQDITNENYFEFWEGIGCELYYRTAKFISASEWKFTRHFTRIGVCEPEVVAKCFMVFNLLKICTDIYNHIVSVMSQEIPAISPNLDRILIALSLQPVLDRWRAFVLTLPQQDAAITEEEANDMRLSISQISEMWSDPIFIHQIQIDMMAEYKDEIYSSECMYKKILLNQHEIQKELEKEAREIKNEEIKKQLKIV